MKFSETYYPKQFPNVTERIELIRLKLKSDFLFREFLNDLPSKSSWQVVCLYPELKLSAIAVTHLRNVVCPSVPRLAPEYRRYEQPGNLRIVYSQDELGSVDVAA